MVKPDKKYWQKRFEQLTDALLRDSMDCYDNAERIYRQAMSEIEKDIARWYMRLAENNNMSFADARKLLTNSQLKDFKLSLEEYIRRGKENGISADWSKQLENASAKYHISRMEALEIQIQQHLETLYGNQLDNVDNALRNVYSEGYYRTAYELQKAFSTGFDVHSIDAGKIEKVLAKPWVSDGVNFSERLWSDKDRLINSLQTELVQGLVRGDAQLKIVQRFAKRMNTSLSNAGRLIATESAYFAALAEKDSMKDLGVEKYEVLATLDNKTSEICREMDGKVFKMSEFMAGVTAPPFHCWCRSCTVPYIEDLEGLRAARNDAGKVYSVPGSMKYPEWKKKFVKNIDFNDKHQNQNLSTSTTNVIMGVKQQLPLKIEEAIVGANPNYSKGMEYKINCQRCVATYEFRRRGYDVVANPYPKKNNKFYWGSECFTDKNGNPVDYTHDLTETQIKTILNSSLDNSRYSVYIQWKNSKSAHVFIAEKVNGVVKFMDPQSGTLDVSSYFARGKRGKFGLFRMDDKEIINDDSILSTIFGVK